MPITFDARQLAALAALRWLHSESEADRRTGRSTVLAVSCLYRAIEVSRWGDDRGWVGIEDHVDTYQSHSYLARAIQDLLHHLSLNDCFEMRVASRSVRIRLSGGGLYARHILQRSFGTLSEPLAAGVLKSIQGSSEDTFSTLPQTTMWDLLTDDD